MNFDLKEVAAQISLEQSRGDVEACRSIFYQKIFDWNDYFKENHFENWKMGPIKERIEEFQLARHYFYQISELWLSLIRFEVSLKQFKKATEIIENYLKSDPIIQYSGKLIAFSSDYFLNRKKPSSAQKLFLQGLCKKNVMPKFESDALWNHFLDFMRKIQPDVTLTSLYEAVLQQLNPEEVDSLSPLPDSDFEDLYSTFAPIDSSIIAKICTYEKLPLEDITTSLNTKIDQEITFTEYLETKDSSDIGSSLNGFVDDLDNTYSLSPEQLFSIFYSKPTMLFIPLSPSQNPNDEITKDSFLNDSLLNDLDDEEKEKLESFLGISIKEIAEELDQALSKLNMDNLEMVGQFFGKGRLEDTNNNEFNYSDNSISFNSLLGQKFNKCEEVMDIIEGLFYHQSLKERHFNGWAIGLQRSHQQERAHIIARITASSSQSSTTTPTLASLKHHPEVVNIDKKYKTQHQLLHVLINKTLYHLLLEQQKILLQIDFPYFSTSFLRKLELTILSNKDAISTISSNNSSFFDSSIIEIIKKQRKLINVLLYLRLRLLNHIQILKHELYNIDSNKAIIKSNPSELDPSDSLKDKDQSDEKYNESNPDLSNDQELKRVKLE